MIHQRCLSSRRAQSLGHPPPLQTNDPAQEFQIIYFFGGLRFSHYIFQQNHFFTVSFSADVRTGLITEQFFECVMVVHCRLQNRYELELEYPAYLQRKDQYRFQRLRPRGSCVKGV